MKPAIVVVAYNRPEALKRLLQSISKADFLDEDITIVISIDKADNEEHVVAVAEEFEWKYGEKHIRTFETRQGLRKHVLQCGDLSEEYGAVIILEDDLIVSPGFYNYVTEALKYYKNDSLVTGVALYSHEWNGYAGKNFRAINDEYDTYLGQFSITWGQCWTYEWWKKFRQWYEAHEDKLTYNRSIPDQINKWSAQSWGKYFVNYIVDKNLFYVIPRVALSSNCSEIGQHARFQDSDHQVALLNSNKMRYTFAPSSEAIKYDIYFENLKLKSFLPEGIAEEGVTIDLAGYGRENTDDRYLLSTKILPFRVVRTYGLQLRPIDLNVIHDIPGKEIFLYDTMRRERNSQDNLYGVIRYEIRGLSNKSLLKYLLVVIFNKLLRRKY